MTARELWEHLELHYRDTPDEILLYTFWDSTDVEQYLTEETEMTKEELWAEVVEEADYSLDEGVSLTNDVISGMVYELLEKEAEDV